MAKEKKPTKSKQDEQAQLLNLLRIILPKVAPDPALAEKIYSAFEAELRIKNRASSFEKFCERIPLPDLEANTLAEVKQQLVAGFGEADLSWSRMKMAKACGWMFRCRMARSSTAGSSCGRMRRKRAMSRKSL